MIGLGKVLAPPQPPLLPSPLLAALLGIFTISVDCQDSADSALLSHTGSSFALELGREQ